MRTVLRAEEALFTAEGSRFLCRLHPARTKEEAAEIVRGVRRAHPKAAHVVSAFRSVKESAYDDDGEPAQTAGAPLLSLLEGEDIIDALFTCVRYFGGTKLGKGGLIRAYSEAGRAACRAAEFLALHYVKKVQLTYAYEDQGLLEHALQQEAVFRGETRYTDLVQSLVYLAQPEGLKEKFQDWTQGRGRFDEGDWVYISQHSGTIAERETNE